MDVEIKNKKENMLLSRIEVEAVIGFEKNATPSKVDVRKGLSKVLEVDKDLIVVKKIDTEFGNTKANVLAFQYINKEELARLESQFVKKQEEDAKKKAEAKAKEGPKAEEKKEEKPAEKKKEEKAEEKKEEPKKEDKPAEEKKEAPKAEEKKE